MTNISLSLRYDALNEQQRLRELPYYTNPEDEKYGQLISKGVFTVQELPPRIARENNATMNFEQAKQLFAKLDKTSPFSCTEYRSKTKGYSKKLIKK